MEIENDPYQPINEALNDSTDMIVTKTVPVNIETSIVNETRNANIPVDNIIVKKELAQNQANRKQPKNVKFTSEEDQYLKQGIEKYGRRSWAIILKDPSFQFHPTRTRDSLRVRADSVCFRKLFGDSN